MKYIVTINNKNYEVEVERGQAHIVRTTQAAEIPVQVHTPAVPAAPAPVIPAAPVPPSPMDPIVGELLKAPMPGIIVSVNILPGAAVKKGEVLVILEAMKMESEIVAPRDGIISQIVVAKGASVSTGDILLALQ